MTLVTGIAVYVVVWWIVLFAVLPWGVRQPDTVQPGHDEGAPENPRLWLKAGITTVVAAVIWAGIFFVVQSGWISFRDMAR